MTHIFGEQLAKLGASYTEYLVRHVEAASTIESWIKTLSYLVAGKISKSHSDILAELMYSSSNLLTLLNDYLLRRHHHLHKPQEDGERSLKMMLSAIEALQVFVEISARRYSQPHVKWILILCIELIKTVGRFLLLYKYKIGLRLYPVVKRLNRKQMSAETEDKEEVVEDSESSDSYYTLPGSGRRIKSISAKYKVQTPQTASNSGLTQEQIIAESLHNIQPFIYLSTAAWFGEKAWLPWVASLATDYASLLALRQKKFKYKRKENAELLRRRFMLLMYLLRSPFYDKYSKMRLIRMLTVMSRVPGLGYIMTSIKEYLPQWQSTYFYTWSS
ncbi:peroxisomal membrane protein PEX16-like isoform X1 [Watersipora subatra]|uniref:peroxisomal membrane protein PEX16-like isoform X1 n=1 Tax=Watersipora subatra TaxID=2589382 RepID=UPI00355B1406